MSSALNAVFDLIEEDTNEMVESVIANIEKCFKDSKSTYETEQINMVANDYINNIKQLIDELNMVEDDELVNAHVELSINNLKSKIVKIENICATYTQKVHIPQTNLYS